MAMLEERATILPNTHQVCTQGEGSRDGIPPPPQSATGALPEDEEFHISLSATQEQKLQEFIKALASQIGEVILIEASDTYKG